MKPFRRKVPADPPSEDHLSEATSEDWFWGRLAGTGTEEDRYWRRMTDGWSQKDVLPSTYLDLHNGVFEAYNANPMANAIVEIGVNFVLGEGLDVRARDPRVQACLDAFWDDPDNHLNRRQYDIATELSLYGELFIRFFVNPFSGAVKIAMIDPSTIDEIECDPENIERVQRVHRRALGTAGSDALGGPPLAGRDSSRDGRGPLQSGTWFSVPDEVMHFAINKVTNAKRGKSDLATLLPWLRRYKDWLIDRVRINKYKAAFLWDVQLVGADRKTIETKMMEYARPPEPGSVLVHNESERWAAVQPNIDAGDAEADGHAIKMMVAMGAGLPEHYLSDGGDVNRATASEMGLPIVKKYQRRQDYLGYLLRAVLDRVIAEALRAGALPPGSDLDYEIRFPPLMPDHANAHAEAALAMARALQIARPLDLVSQETAAAMFHSAGGTEMPPAGDSAAQATVSEGERRWEVAP